MYEYSNCFLNRFILFLKMYQPVILTCVCLNKYIGRYSIHSSYPKMVPEFKQEMKHLLSPVRGQYSHS